ncbi:MAG: hypothetical protein R2848_07945 [Thermomicrobiales bacterium]
MDFDRIERLLGIGFPVSDVEQVLTDLGFEPSIFDGPAGRQLTVTIPTFRSDVSIPEDIVEKEVGRVMGYDKVPATLPVGRTVPVVRDQTTSCRPNSRQILTSAGVSEAVTYITASGEHAVDVPGRRRRGWSAVPPASGFAHAARESTECGTAALASNTLIPALLETVAANLRHQRRFRSSSWLASISRLAGTSCQPRSRRLES